MMKQGKKQLKVFGFCLAFALLVLSIFFVSGLSITNFYGQSNATNTTFHNNSNQTLFVEINRYANVSELFLNITGLKQYDDHLAFNNMIDTEDTNLKAWYKLDEDVTDSSYYGNDGTNEGATSTTTHAFGSAYNFDGDNDCIQVDDDSSLNITGDITLSAWVYVDTYEAWRRIIAKSPVLEGAPYTTYGLLLGSNSETNYFADGKNAIRMELGSNGTQHFVRSTTSIEENTWYLITGTYNQSSGDAKLYINGVLDNETLYKTIDYGASTFNTTIVNNLTLGAIDSSSNKVTLGSSGYGGVCSGFLDGKIDEAQIYDKVLTAEEIYNLYRYNSNAYTQNETFTIGDTTETHYLEIPRYSNVTNAIFNLTGYNPTNEWVTIDEEDSYSCVGTFYPSMECNKAVNERWDGDIDGYIYASSYPTSAIIYENMSYTGYNPSSINWTFQAEYYKINDDCNFDDYTYCNWGYIKVSYWNYDTSAWTFLSYSNCKTTHENIAWTAGRNNFYTCSVEIPSAGIDEVNKKLMFKTDMLSVTQSVHYMEGALNISDTGINNPSINASNFTIWEHNGVFNSTNNPNQTEDFSSTLNSILNNGSCNIGTASLDGDNCIIPIKISSDTPGTLNFGNLNITTSYPTNLWLEVGTADGTREWNYTGEYSTTTKTNNLSSQMNSALSDGACNCTGCAISGQYCQVPFIFHSDQGGRITTDNIFLTYETTYEINTNAISYVDILELDEAVVYGKNATSYLADSITYHDFVITDDTQDTYLMISYAELNAILTIYVNGYEVGTIPAEAGGTGAWKSAVFDVTSSQLLTSNTITVSASASNSDTAYINEMYFIQSNRRDSIYLQNGTAIAVLTDISGIPDYMALNISYDNTTNVLQEDLDLSAYHNTTEGKIINIFKTEQYDGNVTLTALANQTDKATVLSSNNWTIIVDKNIPTFNTITTSLTNLLAGRTYALTLNQTESNPSYISFNLNGVSQGNLTQNGTYSELWHGNITYVDGYTNNISITSYDLAGNSYTYSFSTNVSKATTTETSPDYNTSMSKTNYFNLTSTDTNYSATLKKILTTATEGYSYIDDLELNTTISDTYPINIYALLDNSTINFTDNDTAPNWTTDAFNNTETNIISFTNDLVYEINNSIIVKYGDVGIQNERLFWAKTENLTSEINNTWFRFPIRTAYDRASYSIQMKVCSAGHTYGGTSCSSWDIVTTTFYRQTDSTYNGGIYPTVDEDGDGNIDYIYFKVPSINSSEVILYSFDTIAGGESDWSENLGGAGGGGSSSDDVIVEEDKGLIDSLIDKTGAVGTFLKGIGSFLDDYLFRPIGYLFTSISSGWSDTVGFFVVSILVLISGIILFLSGGSKKKAWYKSGFQT